MGLNMELDGVGAWHGRQNTQHVSVHPLALSPHRAGLFSVHSLCVFLTGRGGSLVAFGSLAMGEAHSLVLKFSDHRHSDWVM